MPTTHSVQACDQVTVITQANQKQSDSD